MKDQQPKSAGHSSVSLRLAGRIARGFIDSKLTPLVIVAALLLGAFSILKTPREEEPQIVVPMLDVFVQMPGASSDEVAQRVSLPMERLLREVPGVEYIYSISHPGMSMLVVRFYVGTKEEDAIIQTYNKLYSNLDRIPPGVSQPIIKVRSIDDVPVMALTLWGRAYDSYRLRQVAGELENSIKPLDDVSETKIIGGQPRQLRVVLDTQRLAAYGLTPNSVVRTCVRSWWESTAVDPCTCATWPKNWKTARPKRTPMFCLRTLAAAPVEWRARNLRQ
jgi:multidrug efflux pump subunit AcrB